MSSQEAQRGCLTGREVPLRNAISTVQTLYIPWIVSNTQFQGVELCATEWLLIEAEQAGR